MEYHRIGTFVNSEFLARQSVVLLLSLFLISLAACGNDEPGEDAGSGTDSASVSDSGEIGNGDEPGLPADTGDVVEDAEGTYRLTITPKVGEVYKYRLESNGSSTMADISQTKKETFDLTMNVMNVNEDGSVVLGVTYNRIRASVSISAPLVDSTGRPVVDSAGKVKIGKENVSFDTQGGQNVPGGERYRAFIGRQVLVSMKKDGTVTDVTNVEPILNATLKSMKVKSDTVNPKALEYSRIGILTQIVLMVNQLFFTLAPDSAVSVGSSWTRSDSVPVSGLPAKAAVTMTLKAIREAEGERRAEITTALKTAVRLPKKNIDDQYYTMKIDKVDVSGSGSWTLSLSSGFPVTRSSTIKSSVVGTATMKEGPEKGKSQKVTTGESTRMTVRRTGYTPAPASEG